jgi:predicted nucleotidyltransferase component of viral defense system
MNNRDKARVSLHEDMPLFREAIAFTSAKTGFNGQVIEKDYFCTVLLEDLARHGGVDLIFKGGTCLAKVHAGFYRLSEVSATRTERSRAADAIKRAVANVSERLPCFSCQTELKGANDSTQYSGIVTYRSVVSGEQEAVLVDVSVREPSLTAPAILPARTVLLDPIGGRPAVPDLDVACITALEAMAEKFRAALSRRDVAIRDFYDLDYAAGHLSVDFASPSFIDMVRRKLAIPDNPPVDVGAERMTALRRQVEPKLKTVLREKEFRDFVLDRAIALVVEMAARVA